VLVIGLPLALAISTGKMNAVANAFSGMFH
jgi:hypothetical protein